LIFLSLRENVVTERLQRPGSVTTISPNHFCISQVGLRLQVAAAIHQNPTSMSMSSATNEEEAGPDHSDEKGHGNDKGPVDFFHHDLKEVRSRVLLGWARTGESLG
jgi:hypothetical protein